MSTFDAKKTSSSLTTTNNLTEQNKIINTIEQNLQTLQSSLTAFPNLEFVFSSIQHSLCHIKSHLKSSAPLPHSIPSSDPLKATRDARLAEILYPPNPYRFILTSDESIEEQRLKELREAKFEKMKQLQKAEREKKKKEKGVKVSRANKKKYVQEPSSEEPVVKKKRGRPQKFVYPTYMCD